MRVCQKHFKPATEVLQSLKTGEEFDLCPDCEMELREIIHGKPESEPAEPKRTDRPRRTAGRPKKALA